MLALILQAVYNEGILCDGDHTNLLSFFLFLSERRLMNTASFSEKEPRSSIVRSIDTRQRGTQLPNSPSKVQLVDQREPEAEQEQEESQEPLSIGARLAGCVPNSPSGFLFFLFVVTYLVCGAIRFAHTYDGSMLTTLLPYLAGYVGIPLVTPLIPVGKKKGDDRQD